MFNLSLLLFFSFSLSAELEFVQIIIIIVVMTVMVVVIICLLNHYRLSAFFSRHRRGGAMQPVSVCVMCCVGRRVSSHSGLCPPQL